MPRYSLRVNIVRPNDGPHLLTVFLQNELSKHIEHKGFGNFRELQSLPVCANRWGITSFRMCTCSHSNRPAKRTAGAYGHHRSQKIKYNRSVPAYGSFSMWRRSRHHIRGPHEAATGGNRCGVKKHRKILYGRALGAHSMKSTGLSCSMRRSGRNREAGAKRRIVFLTPHRPRWFPSFESTSTRPPGRPALPRTIRAASGSADRRCR